MRAALLRKLNSLTRRFGSGHHDSVVLPQLYDANAPTAATAGSKTNITEDDAVTDKLLQAVVLFVSLSTVVLALHAAIIAARVSAPVASLAWVALPALWGLHGAVPPLLFFASLWLGQSNAMVNLVSAALWFIE